MNRPDSDQTQARGIGLGLRRELFTQMCAAPHPEIEWVELHPENYILRGGLYETILSDAHARWPILPHGLTLSLGSTERFDADYTRRLRALLDELNAPWYSDHLCFGGVDGAMLHDLLPLPFSRAAVAVAVDRIAELQDALGRPVAIENISWYAHPGPREMEEIDFLLEVLDQSGAKLMLDVNNVYVNGLNHGFDPRPFIERLPADRVVQMHVAGHGSGPASKARPVIDTHGQPVCDGVYELFGHALRHTGPVPVLLERDMNYPPLDELLIELRRLRAIYDEACPA